MDLEQVGKRRISYPDKDQQYFKSSIQYYLNLAESLIKKYATNMAYIFLHNEDVISNIATSMMMADWRFDGRGDRSGYRKSCGRLALLACITRYQNNRKIPTISMNDAGQENYQFLLSLVDKKQLQPYQILQNKEQTRDLYKLLDILTERQRQCIIMNYFEGLNNVQIGTKLGITRSAVQQNIANGLQKLQRLNDGVC
jgi:RNA polymerase sigma factor (sigma-70 family)